MTTALQLRRGTATQHAGFTGLLAEVTVDTDYHSLRVHDGATKGGFLLAKLSDVKYAVRYDSSQTLTDAQKTQARSNIQAAKEPANLGLVVKTGVGSSSSVTLQQGKGISVQGGDGLSGNPTIINTGVTSINGQSGDVTLSFQQGEYQGGHGQVFTSSGTFTVPTGVTCVKVTVLGGGGNAGNGSHWNDTSVTRQYTNGGSGGAGGFALKYISGLVPGTTISVTVGGVAGSSSFGSYCSATGGGNGTNASGIYCGSDGQGGTGAGGDLNLPGNNGGTGSCGGTPMGGFGLGGGPAINSSGIGYGAGGNANNGKGTPGLVIVEW